MLRCEHLRRCLVENRAATDASASDPELRPLHTALTPEEMRERIVRWVASQRIWKVAQEHCPGDGSVTLDLVRTTRLFHFRDDVRVRIEPLAEGGAVMAATSQSRVGRGDFGQNARNLRELVRGVR